MELKQIFQYAVQLQEIMLAVPTRLGFDLETIDFDLDVDRGKLLVHARYRGQIILTSEQIALCRRFQAVLFRILLDHHVNNLQVHLGLYSGGKDCAAFDYLLLPCVEYHVDWKLVSAVQFLNNISFDKQVDCIQTKCLGRYLHTKNGLVCICMLENSLVCTPHNGSRYCITGTLDGYDGNSNLELRNGSVLSCKSYFKKRRGINLRFERQILLKGRRIFSVQNCLQ
ncbi:endoribonuclease Dicer2 [Dorcoceras hygrometricum]|uniref:Endoribonuclease Dicer2 n=1 Tax=Dorcoceras hygrometricum TaxID=472368 RepID=A0A2Z7D3X3_9LAMI|nr:endoribonuclease Dicer2 [Dorcoceras hygrometricum]